MISSFLISKGKSLCWPFICCFTSTCFLRRRCRGNLMMEIIKKSTWPNHPSVHPSSFRIWKSWECKKILKCRQFIWHPIKFLDYKSGWLFGWSCRRANTVPPPPTLNWKQGSHVSIFEISLLRIPRLENDLPPPTNIPINVSQWTVEKFIPNPNHLGWIHNVSDVTSRVKERKHFNMCINIQEQTTVSFGYR